MGYTTDFAGAITVTPPLNPSEVAYLIQFANTRHSKRKGGPYVTSSQDFGPDVIDDRDHDGAPGYWCNWEPTDDGTRIMWNGGEKFYDSTDWMRYVIDHFLKPGAHAQGHEGFEQFTFDHTLNGAISAQGEDHGDRWRLIVTDNKVTRQA